MAKAMLRLRASCRARAPPGALASASMSTARRGANWLEENCGDVPVRPRAQDLAVSEMMRGGHVLQVASAALLDAKLQSAARGPASSFSATHTRTLEELKQVEDKGVERLVHAVEKDGFRFRPSATVPIAQCSSFALGTVLSLFGETVSTSYLTGVKSAIAEYYNDQIREIYAEKPDESELKDIFKATRDDELVFVDEHTPDALDPAKYDQDPVRSFAQNSTKVLLQISTRV